MISFSTFKISTLLFLLYLFALIATEDLDYSSLETMGVACYPRDTCRTGTQIPFENRSCECDPMCTKYKDCCIDAIQSDGGNFGRVRGLDCLPYESQFEGVYVVSKCKRNLRGSNEVRVKCENMEDLSDPLAAAPVTDISSNITYRNHYCAQCNDVHVDWMRSWRMNIECDEIPDKSSMPLVDPAFVEDHLTYVTFEDNSNSWGFYHPQANQTSGEVEFYPCAIRFQLPDTLQLHVRHCRPQLVSNCLPSWRREIVRKNCKSYTAVVYAGSKTYKNPHCAYCNLKNLEDLRCSSPTITGRNKPPALSFTLLLDINTRDGDRVGEVITHRCKSGQKWDPFFKKCRTLVCVVPGYKIRNGRCVKP